MSRHVRKGDFVVVNSGKHKGSRGKIVEVLVDANRVRVEGIALVKRHLKPGANGRQEGGIVEKLGSIHLSNVQPICPTTDKATRVGKKILADGRKVRIARRSGEELGVN